MHVRWCSHAHANHQVSWLWWMASAILVTKRTTVYADSGQGFVYSGQIEKGQMHGKGTLVYPNGEKYEVWNPASPL